VFHLFELYAISNTQVAVLKLFAVEVHKVGNRVQNVVGKWQAVMVDFA
jgi:hypothetical protein